MKSATELHTAARTHRQNKEYVLAYQLLERSLAESPRHLGCLLEMGYVTYNLKNFDQTEFYLNKALELKSNKTPVALYRTLARALKKNGKDDQALKILNEGLVKYPDDERSRALLENWSPGAKRSILSSQKAITNDPKLNKKILNEEFPEVSKITLNKFVNYDEFLGWEPKPVYEVEGICPEKLTRSRQVERNGTRYQPQHNIKLMGPHVEFFGDSRCFCNEVNPDETFQYYLEVDYRIGPCKNFGVGNYGADQAFLRANRKLSGNGGVAILLVQSLTLLRICSVYKHYLEKGNFLAVKPRFIIDGEDTLKLIKRPFTDKNELCNLQQYADFFHEYDEHYKPFLTHTVNSLTQKEPSVLASTSPEYLARLAQGNQGKLFALIGREFCNLAQSRGCKDAFLVVDPYVRGQRGRKIHHQEVMRSLRYWFNMYNVPLYDFGDAWFSVSDQERILFTADSTHLSAEGNRFKAGWLANILSKRNQIDVKKIKENTAAT